MGFRLEDDKKFSKVAELIAAAPAVVRADMNTWIERTKVDAETGETKGTGWFDTPFGPMNNMMVKGMQPVLVKATIKGIYAKNGRSKYMPHQGVKECARRLTNTK